MLMSSLSVKYMLHSDIAQYATVGVLRDTSIVLTMII